MYPHHDKKVGPACGVFNPPGLIQHHTSTSEAYSDLSPLLRHVTHISTHREQHHVMLITFAPDWACLDGIECAEKLGNTHLWL
ncbi:hypothetical protein AOLI_G00065610 [Acnodon oligacanthus]